MKVKQDVKFNGLGFPVKLINWPHIEIDGQLEPDINYELLADRVFASLPEKPSQLTGAEIKFIRYKMEMTQAAFAKWLRTVDTSTITKWEAKDLKPTGMGADTEYALRLRLIIDKEVKFRRKNIKIDVVNRLLEKKSARKEPMTLDFSEMRA